LREIVSQRIADEIRVTGGILQIAAHTDQNGALATLIYAKN
jgi:hypothetical protein